MFKTPQMPEYFRAGYEAAAGNEYTEVNAQAAWESYIGVSSFIPYPNTPEAFVRDWNNMVAQVSTTCTQYGMRKPDMVFHPEWLECMRALSGQYIAGTLIHMGVRVKFATWQQVEALKEI